MKVHEVKYEYENLLNMLCTYLYQYIWVELTSHYFIEINLLYKFSKY